MINENVPGLDYDSDVRNIQAEPDNLPPNHILYNGVITPQTLKCCPDCGGFRIEIEAIATFRLTQRHLWSLVPIDQSDLIELLNQNDNHCVCADCEWEGQFGDLLSI